MSWILSQPLGVWVTVRLASPLTFLTASSVTFRIFLKMDSAYQSALLVSTDLVILALNVPRTAIIVARVKFVLNAQRQGCCIRTNTVCNPALCTITIRLVQEGVFLVEANANPASAPLSVLLAILALTITKGNATLSVFRIKTTLSCHVSSLMELRSSWISDR